MSACHVSTCVCLTGSDSATYVRNRPAQTNEIGRPHVPVQKTLFQHAQAQSFAVVHVSLRRIVTDDAVGNDFLLALVKPTLLATEPTRRGVWA